MLYRSTFIIKANRHNSFSGLLWTKKTTHLSRFSATLSVSEEGLPHVRMGSKATKQCEGVFAFDSKRWTNWEAQNLRSACEAATIYWNWKVSVYAHSPISCCQKSSPVLCYCLRFFLEIVLQTFNCTCWSLLPVEMLLSTNHSQVRQGQDETMNGF